MLNPTSLSSDLQTSFHHLLSKRTGLVVRDSDRETFVNKLLLRIEVLNLSNPKNYYLFLKDNSQESEKEWQHLVALLTNNESYFFRDKQQIQLLQDHIFPEIIERKQIDKTIRVCSAGCSTGEEPYSLAILLSQLIPNYHEWNLDILGVDINQEALRKAKNGVYNPWSLRAINPSVIQTYFKEVKKQYHLDDNIKRMVRFRSVNLVKDSFFFGEIDLFICRNVFIYFNLTAIATVLDKLHASLHPHGYLLTGHTELSGQNLHKFTAKVFSQSLIYQRRANNSIPEKSNHIPAVTHEKQNISKPLIPPLTPIKSTQKSLASSSLSLKNNPVSSIAKTEIKQLTNDQLLKTAEDLIKKERYDAAIEKVKKVLKNHPNNFQAYYLLAQISANKGLYEEAVTNGNRALQIDCFAIAPHYLLAQIAEETGKLEEAKSLLKKIIYLEPSSVGAYLDLSHIYAQEGDDKRAVKMYQESLNILKKLPPNTPIVERGNRTASQLLFQLQTANWVV